MLYSTVLVRGIGSRRALQLMNCVHVALAGRWWCVARGVSVRSPRRTGCGVRSARSTTWRASRATRASGSCRPASASACSPAACSAPRTTPTCSSCSTAPTPSPPPVRSPPLPLGALPSELLAFTGLSDCSELDTLQYTVHVTSLESTLMAEERWRLEISGCTVRNTDVTYCTSKSLIEKRRGFCAEMD